MTTGGSIWGGWKTGLLVGMAMVGLACAARAADPVVSGISASQRSGTKLVDITYNLSADANCTVSVQVSTNNGSTYDLSASSFSGSGYGSGVTPGTGKTIVWDAEADWDGQYSDKVWFKITADDGGGGAAGDYMVIDVSGGPSASSYPVSYLTAVPSGGWTDEYKTTKIVLRKIPAGTFTMGSPSGELGRAIGETQHSVTLSRDFYVGVFEVTQKQWERVTGDWPGYFTNTTYRDSRPVERVSYNDIRGSSAGAGWPANNNVDASSFMGKLRAKTGLTTLDLPTESQWEYACRANTTTALNSGKNLTATGSCPNMSEVGRYWYNGGSGYSPSCTPSAGSATVGSYPANAWGLYDMHGNVWEWCLDWYGTYPGTVTDPEGASSGSYRVLRGGSWSFYARRCRSAGRRYYFVYPSNRDSHYGFRLARTLQ